MRASLQARDAAQHTPRTAQARATLETLRDANIRIWLELSLTLTLTRMPPNPNPNPNPNQDAP